MKGKIKVFVENIGLRSYTAYGYARDETGKELLKIELKFENSNDIYPAYKMLAKIINRLPLFGIKEIDVETNSKSMAAELSGQLNERQTLIRIVKDRLNKTGIILNQIIFTEQKRSA